ncbi:hypothetical protein H257_00723 [Aphanomyces astaci]|uniref:Glutathionylspermidine synthase pre-ATP-grasp-like domain-containing protein n=1 Tax=Aphanomyces astaci TaxID=112090 RepID=W4HDQ1_APHAT|nr:hypothetical protein H257_00723 [Aphanomyces astaci]ETV89449.1 hypothetical protein H257_00723 [Aphanomyces astaci]|eukprot:XP_009821849.1 hypothetical protein H257_00723 [Aphanomyces astaci]
MRAAVRASWQRRDRDLLGRFDFSWDGQGDPKLLEYNADTPMILVEMAVGQRLWWDHVHRKEDEASHRIKWCFNTIENQLAVAWPRVVPPKTSLCVAGTNASVEEQEHAAFVAKTAAASGIAVTLAGMDQLSVANGKVVTTWDNTPVPCYEWLAEESLGIDLFADDGSMSSSDEKTVWIEPAWKLVLGNKALLSLLWELYPGHPNLLPATYNQLQARTGVVYSHEFDNPHEFLTAAIDAATVSLPAEGDTLDRVANLFGHTNQDPTLYLGHPVYQAYHETAKFSGRRIVVGSWVIHGQPTGTCIREGGADTTNDSSSFVPHYVDRELYVSLYPPVDDSYAGHVQRYFGYGGGGGSGVPVTSPNLTTQNAARTQTLGPSSGVAIPHDTARPDEAAKGAVLASRRARLAEQMAAETG